MMLMLFFSPYDIDSSVQLVCKYLNAYKNRADISQGINRLYVDNGERFTYVRIIKFVNILCVDIM